MEYNAESEWVANLEQMTCENDIYKIVVKFEKEGDRIVGKIKYMPLDLLIKLAKEMAEKSNGYKPIKKAILESEEVFLQAYHDDMIETENKAFQEIMNRR